MNRKELIKETVRHIQLSFMDEKEKSMWLFLLPSMATAHINRLDKLLKEESSRKIDIFLERYEKKVLAA